MSDPGPDFEPGPTPANDPEPPEFDPGTPADPDPAPATDPTPPPTVF